MIRVQARILGGDGNRDTFEVGTSEALDAVAAEQARRVGKSDSLHPRTEPSDARRSRTGDGSRIDPRDLDHSEALAAASAWFKVVGRQPDDAKVSVAQVVNRSPNEEGRGLTYLHWKIDGYQCEGTHCEGVPTVGVKISITPLGQLETRIQVNTRERLIEALAESQRRESEIAWSQFRSGSD